MSIANVTYRPNPPQPGQPVTVTFETPQGMVPTPDVRMRKGRDDEVPVSVKRTKTNKWEFTVDATPRGNGTVTIVQGTMIKIITL